MAHVTPSRINPYGHVEDIRQRFVALNQVRLERAKSALRPRQRDALTLLPLLFHLHQPRLPGHLDGPARVPCGIYGYQPDGETLAAAQRLLGGIGQKLRPAKRQDIEALFLMGSAGSIAFSPRSDLDVWLCLRSGLEEKQVDALRDKARAVERWAREYGLELHVFVMETARFRQGISDSVSEDNSGSSQHFLLLDEFYRTGVWMAGAHPLWWYVPPEHEDDYDDYAPRLISTGNLSRHQAIDLGGLARVPAGEFFGAALWQLYKGLSAPYKSFLKITLLEAYAREYPATRLLASEFKARLYQGERDPDALDPYLQLLARLEDHAVQDPELLDLLRRCFYFKVDLPLSHPESEDGWRRELLRKTVTRWGWNQDTVEHLDARSRWKYPQVKRERRLLMDHLSRTYLFLSRFARRHGQDRTISAADLDLLGRKIYVAFERKPGKIERVNPGIAPDLSEAQVSLYRIPRENGAQWRLYAGKVEPADLSRARPLKQADHAMELLVWAHINGIIDRGTLVILHTPGSQLNNLEVKSILDLLHKLLPPELIHKDRDQALREPPKVIRSALFVNTGILPRAMRSGLDKQLVSGHADIFRFGSRRENLAQHFDHLTVTSWGEIFVHHYHGMSGLLDCLCRYLQWAPLAQRTPPPPLPVHSFSSHFDHIVTQRLERLLASLVAAFYGAPADTEPRYIIEAEGGYHLVTVDMGSLRHERLPNLKALLSRLERPQLSFSPILVDEHALRDTPLPAILRHNEAGVIQLFRQRQDHATRLFVLDERGSLFVHTLPDPDARRVAEHLGRFLTTVTRRQSLLCPDPDYHAPPLRHYRIHTQGKEFHIHREEEPEEPDKDYLEIRVIGSDQNGRLDFTLVCGEEEFTSSELGEGIFRAAARAIHAHRRAGRIYPAYITDLDLAPALLGLERYQPIQTVHFLHYKRRIEARLSEELSRLQSDDGSAPSSQSRK